MEFPLWTKEAIEARFREYLGDDADPSREAKKRRAIIVAGYHLFLRQGYRKTSIDEIAKSARIGKGTVYLYFANKAELLVHCVAFEKKLLSARISTIFAPETPDRERLRHWLVLTLSAVRDMPLSARLMTGDVEMWDALDDAKSEKLTRMREEGRALAVRLVELAAPGLLDEEEKARRADVLMAMGYLSASFLDPRTRNDRPLDAFLETLTDVLLHGVVPRSAERALPASDTP